MGNEARMCLIADVEGSKVRLVVEREKVLRSLDKRKIGLEIRGKGETSGGHAWVVGHDSDEFRACTALPGPSRDGLERGTRAGCRRLVA